jgi:hypothetical protein
MDAIHARIPMLTIDEREALPKWAAEAELEAWQRNHASSTWSTEQCQQDIARYEGFLASARASLAECQEGEAVVTEGLKEVQAAVEQGKPVPRQLVKTRKAMELMFLAEFSNRPDNPELKAQLLAAMLEPGDSPWLDELHRAAVAKITR